MMITTVYASTADRHVPGRVEQSDHRGRNGQIVGSEAPSAPEHHNARHFEASADQPTSPPVSLFAPLGTSRRCGDERNEPRAADVDIFRHSLYI